MEFNYEARSTDTIQPVYHFDGDAVIDSQTYEQCMTGGYMSTVSFAIGAVESFGVKLDAQTLERWKRICNAAYFIDDYIDNAADTKTACDMYDASMDQVFMLSNDQLLDSIHLPSGADSLLLPAIVLMKNSVQTMPEAQLAALKDAAQGISAVARQKQDCDRTDAYISLLKSEAYFTSRLITESASGDVRNQPGYDQFVIWCSRLMELAILGDSTIDMKDDNRQRVMQIDPTVRNMAKLALKTVGAGQRIISDSPQRRATIASLVERTKFYWPKLR